MLGYTDESIDVCLSTWSLVLCGRFTLGWETPSAPPVHPSGQALDYENLATLAVVCVEGVQLVEAVLLAGLVELSGRPGHATVPPRGTL